MSTRLRRLWAWLLFPALLGLVAWGWWASFRSVAQARSDLRALEERCEQLREENRALRAELASLEHEPEARASEARRTLAVAAPDEVLVVVPTPKHGD